MMDDSNTPKQIHISILGGDPRTDGFSIMWVTKNRTPNPSCQYNIVIPDNEEDKKYYESLYSGDITSILESSVEVNTLSSGWEGYIYKTVIKGLIPNCFYSYRVGDIDLDVWSEFFNFKTQPIGPFPATIVTFADFDTVNLMNKENTTMTRLARNLSEFDMILQFGDISYADGDQKVWDDFFNHIQPIAAVKPWMVTVGNHEKEDNYGFESYEKRFTMPDTKFWYSINYGYAHITIISTEHPLDEGTEQYDWLVNDLRLANRNRMSQPWLIITGHKALYGSNKRWFQKEKAKTIRSILVPIIDRYGVDLAIFGHCHAYERTHPLIGGEIDPNGTVHLLAGVAGAKLDKEWYPQPQWSAYRTAHHGYGLLHIKNYKKMRFCYHRERDGLMWDAFTIKKKRNGRKEIYYDYENKFLSNWVRIPMDPSRSEKSRRKMQAKGYGHVFEPLGNNNTIPNETLQVPTLQVKVNAE